jgi:HlyD family secretion protein
VVQVRNAAQTNQNVITYDAVIGVNNEDQKLKPGMTANVSIVIAQTNNALKIPNAALRFRPETGTNTASVQADSGQKKGDGGLKKTDKAPGEHSTRTVYVPVMGEDGKIASLKQVQIKTGINDGIHTQVIDGLKEGDEVVLGMATSSGDSGNSNPFGMRRF